MKEAPRWGSLAILSLLILGIGAAMAAPGLGCGSKLNANSTAAIATLRSLVSCQERFRAFARCDTDGDGKGEYGTLGEMTLAAGIRADALGAARGARLAEPLLSTALAAVDGEGIVVKSGYAFRIFLPARGGGASREARPGDPLSRPVDTDGAEESWCAYAWPMGRKGDRSRAFFVTGRGDIIATANENYAYIGEDRCPAWDGAFPAGTGNGWSAPAEGKTYVGRDGNQWWPVK